MGHLALRYLDASRSGVYRVADAAVPRKAAGEAGAILTGIELGNGAGGSAVLEGVLADAGVDPRVVIIDGADALAQARGGDYAALVAELEAAAAARRERGAPFYAVLVDPRAILELPPLYKETHPGK